ncbi:MAG: hypothetical protein KDJ80_14095 [Nitratireductor sp.]|nr:hypothetical protein [Nitratireductor sp.]
MRKDEGAGLKMAADGAQKRKGGPERIAGKAMTGGAAYAAYAPAIHALVVLTIIPLAAALLAAPLAMPLAIPAAAGTVLAQDDAKPAGDGAQPTASEPEEADEAMEGAEGTGDGASGDATGKTAAESDAELPDVITDPEEIPFPARKMRELILTAARSGDIEKLRPYLGYGDDVTMLSLAGYDDDPIAFLRSLSGDPEGHEILAIITEILEVPPVRVESGTGDVLYVWPYFYSYPFDRLTPEQRVQMFRIITHGDYEEMTQFGSYIFYRLGITPEGRWRFFVAGD